MENEHNFESFYSKYVKRAIDIFVSFVVLLLFSWLYAVVAIMVRLKLGSPILFIQERPGRINKKTGKERIFKLYKFRTMTDETNENGCLKSDEERLTKFGKLLRKTSLDEIPEMVNILKGDMSLVGPRPLLVRYLDRYTEEQHHRHDVRPGLTGYAQANGRNALSWEDRFAMDVWYTKHVTFKNDVKIVFKTIKTVLKTEGINSQNSVTMEEFMGTPDGVKAKWHKED